MFRLALVACCLTFVYSQTCQDTFTSCVTKKKQDREAQWKAFKDSSDACYTANGCTAPNRTHVAPNFTHPKGSADHIPSPSFVAAFKACEEAAKGSILQCVQKTVPNFQYPAMNKSGEHHGFGGGHAGFYGHNHGGEHDHVLEQCKKDETAAKAVEACLSALKTTEAPSVVASGTRTRRHEQHGHEGGFHTNPMFQIFKECNETQTPDCRTEMQNVKAALCSCSKDDSIKNQVGDCIKAALPIPAPGATTTKPRYGGWHGNQNSGDQQFGFDFCEPKKSHDGDARGGIGGWKGKGNRGHNDRSN